MNGNMNKNTKIVLAFEIKPEKEQLIKSCCASVGADYRRMLPSDHKKTLGSLAGITGIPAKTTAGSMGEKIEQEMLVFSGFESEVLEAFLELYRTQGIEKIDYKATVTIHNIFWTPEMLYQELKKEHAAMTKK